MERDFCAAIETPDSEAWFRGTFLWAQGKRNGEVMRESGNSNGRIKDEQKGVVLERGRSLRKVKGQKCHFFGTHPKQHSTPWPYIRLFMPPLSRPAIQLLRSFIVYLGPGFHGSFPKGPWSLGTFCSSALHSSSFIFPHFLLY